ncbi:MAG: Holliday junction resolvase RuvX, partial [Polyangiales bacterium]
MSRIVGVDPGAARVGVAISDEARSIAFPRETVPARGGWADAAKRVKDALAADDVGLLVVGLPLR